MRKSRRRHSSATVTIPYSAQRLVRAGTPSSVSPEPRGRMQNAHFCPLQFSELLTSTAASDGAEGLDEISTRCTSAHTEQLEVVSFVFVTFLSERCVFSYLRGFVRLHKHGNFCPPNLSRVPERVSASNLPIASHCSYATEGATRPGSGRTGVPVGSKRQWSRGMSVV